jgi:hypothetical protein
MQEVEIPPEIVNDISILNEEELEMPNGGVRSLKSLNNKISVGEQRMLKKSKIDSHFTTKKIRLTEILGMISQSKELFLFDKKISVNDDKPESSLQKVELSMQETVGKRINYAVASFPKQSLDEWILDHPQQIILTTIHLILTHEVNELFEEMKRNGRGVHHDGEGEDMSDEDASQYSEEEITPKTPNTRDLIKHSKVSSMWEGNKSSQMSYRSSLRILKAKEEGQKTDSVAEEKKEINMEENVVKRLTPSKSITQMTGKSHRDAKDSHDSLNDSEQSKDRRKFAANMFGSDFDINLISEEDKEETMRILQEKSFRGLFLRLQFWINQICKSLYGKGREMELDLPDVHKVIMKSIV